jgi:hypothetical protein
MEKAEWKPFRKYFHYLRHLHYLSTLPSLSVDLGSCGGDICFVMEIIPPLLIIRPLFSYFEFNSCQVEMSEVFSECN